MFEYIIAAIAGFISFISPCVLPLLPAYIGYMGGRVTNTVAAQVELGSNGSATLKSNALVTRLSTFIHGLAFVGGFTIVFVLLGVVAQTLFSTQTIQDMVGRIGGVLVVFLGLHFMGVLPTVFAWLRKRPQILSNPTISVVIAFLGSALLLWGFTGSVAIWDTNSIIWDSSRFDYTGWATMLGLISVALLLAGMVIGGAFIRPYQFWNLTMTRVETALYADTRPQMAAKGNQGLLESGLMGVVFAAGWTPCIGPTLGLALNLVANNPSAGDIAHGAALMTAFSLGLGIPFLIAALMLDSAQGGLRRILRHMRAIKLVSGGFLVLVGFVIATGRLQSLSAEFNGRFGDFSYRVEQCTVGIFEGDVSLGQYGSCVSGDQDFETIKAQNNGEEILVAPQIDAEIETPLENGNISMAESPVDTALNLGAISSIESVAEEIVAPIGLRVGNQAPNFTTTTLDGDTVSLVDYRGQVVILNFWFTTCAPCRIEMPEFQNLTNEYSGQDVVILSVNREESATAIAEFRDDLNLTFPLLLDLSGEIQDLYGIQGYPSSFILDRDGVIQFRTFSAMTVEQIQELVQSALS